MFGSYLTSEAMGGVHAVTLCLQDRGVRIIVAQVEEGSGSRVLCCVSTLTGPLLKEADPSLQT